MPRTLYLWMLMICFLVIAAPAKAGDCVLSDGSTNALNPVCSEGKLITVNDDTDYHQLGKELGTLLRLLFPPERNRSNNASSSNNWDWDSSSDDDDYGRCRAETERHLTVCWTEVDECYVTGCEYKVSCENRSSCTNHSTGPYGKHGSFYCDTRNWRNHDFDKEVVIHDACLGKYAK